MVEDVKEDFYNQILDLLDMLEIDPVAILGEDAEDAGLYWLSFVDPGEGCLGVTITLGMNAVDAIDHSWALELNPGGEVCATKLTADYLRGIPGWYRFVNRLLTPDEAHALNGA